MIRGWLDRGVRHQDPDLPVRVHVLDLEGRTLCGAPPGSGDVTREDLKTRRTRPADLCWACDDVIWNVRRPGPP